jgi:hypothetical protein
MSGDLDSGLGLAQKCGESRTVVGHGLDEIGRVISI